MKLDLRLLAVPSSLLLLAALTLAGCGRKGAADAGDEKKVELKPVAVEMVAASERPMAVTITAQGTLSPAQGAIARVATVNAGRLVSVRVREGERVSAGQLLAVVDSRQQQAQARSAAAALTTSQTQARQAETAARAAATDQSNAVVQARLALRAAQTDRDTSVKQARIALDTADTDLNRLRKGARPQEIAQADQTVAQAKATRDRAATEADRVQYLLDHGIAPQRQLDDAKTALSVAESALTSAQELDSLVRAGARPEELQAAQLRVDAAREALAQAQTSGAAKVQQAQTALRQAQQSALQVKAKQQEAQAMRETAAQRRADLTAAQTVAGYAELRAPISGAVTRRALNSGDMADPATPVVEITDTRTLNLIANLAAEQGAQVRAGARCVVRSAQPEEDSSAPRTAHRAPRTVFPGRVLSVGQVDPQTNLLSVRIAVVNPGGTLRVGTFATAEIIVHVDPHATVVPKQAVVTRDGKSVLFVVGSDNVAHQKAVTLGAEQNGMVEIVRGVAPGTRVIRLGQYELSDGAKVRPASEGVRP